MVTAIRRRPLALVRAATAVVILLLALVLVLALDLPHPGTRVVVFLSGAVVTIVALSLE
jgi:hypothetical protein